MHENGSRPSVANLELLFGEDRGDGDGRAGPALSRDRTRLSAVLTAAVPLGNSSIGPRTEDRDDHQGFGLSGFLKAEWAGWATFLLE